MKGVLAAALLLPLLAMAEDKPIGRFQMVHLGDGLLAVYVLDTATGQVSFCSVRREDDKPTSNIVGINCISNIRTQNK